MKILVVGLNHRTAPIDIRERLAFDATETVRALKHLSNRFDESEFVLLSTCNRVELYSASKRLGGLVAEDLTKFLSEFHGVRLEDFQDFLYVHSDEDAVRHLLTVASSLDSMVVGEAQIIRQVKESYRLACAAKSTGKVLNRLFHCGFATSRKIHTATSISRGRVSMAGFAVELAIKLFEDISSAKVLVIGAGEMGQLLVQHLLHTGCKNITIVNRSYERSLDRARYYGIEARKWEQLEEQLVGADIAIAAARARHYLFSKDSFSRIMSRRRQHALLVVDVAVPRNFEGSVNEIEDVHLYSVDDFSEMVERNRKAHEEDIAKGMEIICENVSDFMDWFKAKDIGPLIGRMREKFAQTSQNELEQFFVGAGQRTSKTELTKPVVKGLFNKLMHSVIKNIKVVANEHGPTEAAKLVESIVRQAEQMAG